MTIPKRVWLAVLVAFVCHGIFILSARYRLSYDAYTHMLFADHYAENWFSLWEPRWYTGFTVVSYPPLTHQLAALFVPLLGFDRAFALVLWIVTSLYPLGVYSFSRIFAGKTAATHAALASALLLPIYVTAYVFGQFPFLTGTLLSLFGAAALDGYLRKGGMHNLLLTLSLYAATMASHHATLILQPFLILAVTVNHALETPRAFQWRQFISRLLLVGILAPLASLLVILPFWEWGRHQAMQTPIDHLSRHNFLADPLAFAIFFFPLYGPLAAVVPFLIRKWHPRFIGLLISFTILFLLGLGGTTPLPRLFFGANWEWLTYDRFAFWASLTLTPFFGMLFIRLKYGWKDRLTTPPKPASSQRKSLSTLTFSFFAVTALGAWFQPLVFPTQPAQLDMQPILTFLDQGDRSQWRYLTFGFGNQFTYLNLLTEAATIDGSYHTVRTLPELRESGIAEVDTSYWALKGISAIAPILERSGERGVRWGFVNRADFIPQLKQSGWVYRETLSNGVQVWENLNAVLPEPSQPPETNPVTSFSWGVFPILALLGALSLGGLRIFPAQAERVLRAIHALAVGLVPISLCFWYYVTIVESPHPRVYFTYTHALAFLTDAFVLLAVILWGFTKISQGRKLPFTNLQISSPPRLRQAFFPLLFTFFSLITISIFWSRDWLASLYISLHCWLLFLFILSLRDWRSSWTPALFGLCIALGVEIVAGFVGFARQSTAFLDPLNMEWPHILDASMGGASVVQLSDGLRILRAYGTLPHPNLLGGFALLTLLGPASYFFAGKKPNLAALLLLCLGIVLIGLTFSRSAWLALGFSMSILIWKSKHLDRERLRLLFSALALTILLTLYPLRDLVFTRLGKSAAATEQISTVGRSWLTQQSLDMILQRPLTGVGVGSFIIELADTAAEGAPIEPVHNIPLLVAAELGMIGLVVFIALFVSIALNIYKSKSPHAVLASATLTGLCLIALFDHYLWTLAPGRVMLGLTLGLWAGQATHDA